MTRTHTHTNIHIYIYYIGWHTEEAKKLLIYFIIYHFNNAQAMTNCSLMLQALHTPYTKRTEKKYARMSTVQRIYIQFYLFLRKNQWLWLVHGRATYSRCDMVRIKNDGKWILFYFLFNGNCHHIWFTASENNNFPYLYCNVKIYLTLYKKNRMVIISLKARNFPQP